MSVPFATELYNLKFFFFPLFLDKAPPLKERQRSRIGGMEPSGDPLDSLLSEKHLHTSDMMPSRLSSEQGPSVRSPTSGGNQAVMRGDSVDGSRQPSKAKQMLTRMQMQEKESSTMLWSHHQEFFTISSNWNQNNVRKETFMAPYLFCLPFSCGAKQQAPANIIIPTTFSFMLLFLCVLLNQLDVGIVFF